MNPDDILNPTVFYAGWEIREPVTSSTDLLVAIVAGVALWRLSRLQQGATWPTLSLTRGYFFCLMAGMGIAAIFGHLLQAYVPWEMKMIGWIFSAFGTGMFEWSGLIQLRQHISPARTRLFGTWILLHHGLFFLAMAIPETRNFDTVKVNSTLSLMCTALPIYAYLYHRTREALSGWFVAALLFGVFPGLTYNLQLSIDRWFNFHDVSHVLLATYVYLLYQGAKRLTKPDLREAAQVAPSSRSVREAAGNG
jgi:hypothetical protein